ncbi:MAG: hypothetical protein HC895_03350 [Leptolyngbyaceae cyanobacterium SM1_3_5]|nr:hypothetical protein [Leptolyngbyaceae cyanobacterium SM1_3_5]
MKTKLKRVFAINYYCVALTSAFLAITFLLNKNAHQIFNQDMLHPASFIVDYRNGVTLSTWHWSPNNYFFPELAFYWLMNLPFRSLPPIYIQTFYMIFSSFIFMLSIYIVSSKIFSFDPKASRSLLAFIGIIFATVYPNYLLPSLRPVYFLLPWIHTGSYVGCLFSLTVIINSELRPSEHLKLQKVLLGLLTFLLCASDYFFVIWFVIPISLTLWHQRRINDVSTKFFIRLTFLILGSGISGYVVHKVTNPSSRKIELETILLSLERFADTLIQHTGILIFISIWLIMSTSGFLMSSSSSVLKADREFLHSSHRAFWLWNFYSLATTFFLINLYGLFYNEASFRYFLPLLYNPVIVFVWLTINVVKLSESYFGKAFVQELNKVFFSVSLAIALLSFPYICNFYQSSRQYELYQCLKNDGVGVLYSEYWNSKAAYVFSEGKIVPRQIADDGTPYPTSNNGAWYTLKPPKPYLIAIMGDTSFGRKIFPKYESKTCNGFDYKLIPSSMERRLMDRLPEPRE